MKNKGFTLVEVLGVIVVLGLIIVIVYPQIKGIITNQQQKLYEEQIDRYKKQANTYMTDKQDTLVYGNNYYIKINDLYSGGYIKDDEIINPLNKKELKDACVYASWNSTRNSYEFEYQETCTSK